MILCWYLELLDSGPLPGAPFVLHCASPPCKCVRDARQMGHQPITIACICAEIWTRSATRTDHSSPAAIPQPLATSASLDFKRQYHLGHPNVEFLLKSLVER